MTPQLLRGRVVTRVLAIIYMVMLATACHAQQMLDNPSFEAGTSYWTINSSYSVAVVPSYNGVSPEAGSKLLTLAGPASVGYSYARIVSQSLTAPFVEGVPNDNFLVYLYAAAYLHTNDGRNVSYALSLEPGYGQAGGIFHGSPQDAWALNQTWGYYIAHDPFDAAAPIKPLTVVLELRDPLQQGEYLLLDDVQLYYGGSGIPEPSCLAAVLLGMAFFATKARNRGSTK